MLCNYVVSAANNVLTLLNGSQVVTLTLSPNTFFHRGGVLVNANTLQPGDVINTTSYNNVVVYAEVTQLASGSNQSFVVSGTFNYVTRTYDGKIATIAINQITSRSMAILTIWCKITQLYYKALIMWSHP